MIEIPTIEDEQFLLTSIKTGDAVLVLGAGASAESTNSNDEPIKQSAALAELLAQRAGLTYSGESLTEVLGAVEGNFLSSEQIGRVLDAEYRKTAPSEDLERLFNYTWKRVYTWNIDDTLENVSNKGVQRRHHFNGIADKVAGYEELSYLHIVHLHGQVTKPEHGFILTETEYNRRLSLDHHDWYRRAAQDYVRYTPIFIGSKLNEPILSLELSRARGPTNSGLGRAYLVSPDSFSQIQISNLASRNIIHIKGTLHDFMEWLEGASGRSLTPTEAISEGNSFAASLVDRAKITATDLETARPIFKITWAGAKADADELVGAERRKAARHFLRGAPPTWRIAASDIPVWLTGTDALYSSLRAAVERRDRLFVAVGQSGSGKTTALLQALLRFSREHPGYPLYEVRGDVRSMRATLKLLERLHRHEHALLYVGDAFLYGASLAEDVLNVGGGRVTVISSARTGEWREHLERHLGEISSTFEYQRFVKSDYEPLIDRLLEYVPAPSFKHLKQSDRLERMSHSKSQLLIALREATESDNFTNVITGEYNDLPDDDCRLVLLTAGVGTLARTGVASEAAREAYERLRASRTFDATMPPLDGIVFAMPGNRLIARHEVYVRHIIENVAKLPLVIDVIIELLRTFTKYRVPITRNVDRLDAALFRFLLNHNFVRDLAKRRGVVREGLRVYQEFEVEFQLDGHYWLQYGQYLVELGDLDGALDVLHKSIQAYPENNYAWHALADVQLRVARRRHTYDSTTTKLIADAVRVLQEQDESPDLQTDQYAIITLAHGHIGALVKHGELDQAKSYASDYFGRIQELERIHSDAVLQTAKERLAHFLAFGVWADVAQGRRIKPKKSGKKRR